MIYSGNKHRRSKTGINRKEIQPCTCSISIRTKPLITWPTSTFPPDSSEVSAYGNRMLGLPLCVSSQPDCGCRSHHKLMVLLVFRWDLTEQEVVVLLKHIAGSPQRHHPAASPGRTRPQPLLPRTTSGGCSLAVASGKKLLKTCPKQDGKVTASSPQLLAHSFYEPSIKWK